MTLKVTNKIADQLNTELPDTLHELLEMALNDLELCEQDPDYDINMMIWHSRDTGDDDPSDECTVCMVGSLLAKTCKLPKSFSLVINDIRDYANVRKFHAVDWVREGRVTSAYISLHKPGPVSSELLCKIGALNRYIIPYRINKVDNKKSLRQLVENLRVMKI